MDPDGKPHGNSYKEARPAGKTCPARPRDDLGYSPRFHDDLGYSHGARAGTAFDRFYRRFFGASVTIDSVRDLRLQRRGVDKVVSLPDGREVRIDEKLRRTDYGDLLIEEFSDFDRRKPGWLSPSSLSDYIAYAVERGDILEIQLFRTRPLRRRAARRWKEWLRRYGRKFAHNGGYRTSALPIPHGEVEDCLAAHARCRLAPPPVMVTARETRETRGKREAETSEDHAESPSPSGPGQATAGPGPRERPPPYDSSPGGKHGRTRQGDRSGSEGGDKSVREKGRNPG